MCHLLFQEKGRRRESPEGNVVLVPGVLCSNVCNPLLQGLSHESQLLTWTIIYAE